MSRRDPGLIAALALTSFVVVAGAPEALAGASHSMSDAERSAVYALSPLGAPPADPTDRVADSPAAKHLGQFLFFDAKLSANGEISCATCHQPARAFTDGRARAKGLALGTRNAPTLLNAAQNHWFFWDGRADSLWAQPLQVFENPAEMGSDRVDVVRTLDATPALRAAYERVFGALPPLHDRRRFPPHARPDPDAKSPPARAWKAMAPADRVAINRAFSNVGKAVAAYVRTLESGDSLFDRYVAALRRGDPAADKLLSHAALRGLKLFVGAAHCNICHSGPDFSDGEFHDLGLPRLPGRPSDAGRADAIRELTANTFSAAGAFSDAPGGAAHDRLAFLPRPDTQLGKFKTPTLRNVAVTAPYMHDGRFATLRQVLDFYAQGKTAGHGKTVGQREATLDLIPHLTTGQITDLIAFLNTLAGSPLPAALTRPPPTP